MHINGGCTVQAYQRVEQLLSIWYAQLRSDFAGRFGQEGAYTRGRGWCSMHNDSPP
ncbi:uncharacterized protein B0H18DRAFT_1006453 [Fomitopsis serialis]|uniref:uncharacterized protein n=1 Tax=Fomitopsis serialis TaxID=139415 RepID=UPI002008473E|nr:uncharacterized protein B0H18DRAFT_1006453 [Neoantrodia serialis]KAH9926503.1 hypothetical protein B0H18DRAFT_1006453 [Neoantrodia serialis]